MPSCSCRSASRPTGRCWKCRSASWAAFEEVTNCKQFWASFQKMGRFNPQKQGVFWKKKCSRSKKRPFLGVFVNDWYTVVFVRNEKFWRSMAQKSQRRRKIWRWLFSKKRSFGSEKNGKILKIECTKPGWLCKNRPFWHSFCRSRRTPRRTKRLENAIFRSILLRRRDVFLSNYFLRKIVSTNFEFSYFRL